MKKAVIISVLILSTIAVLFIMFYPMGRQKEFKVKHEGPEKISNIKLISPSKCILTLKDTCEWIERGDTIFISHPFNFKNNFSRFIIEDGALKLIEDGLRVEKAKYGDSFIYTGPFCNMKY